MLDGKTILITGASSGIGAAAARLLAESGANLMLAARRGDKLNEVRATIPVASDRIALFVGDVSDPSFAQASVQATLHAFGGLDGAFNNAGTLGDLGPVPEMSLGAWNHVIVTNLNSAFLAAKHQIPAMRARGGGSIVFTSSFVGHTIGLPGMAAYAAAKAGLIGLTQVLAVEHGPENIRVNALLPGGTKTGMAGDDPAYLEYVAGLHALKRMAEPEEIARAARFLLSDAGSFVTGSAMLCDGGNSITKA
ncbi:SDR family oxidoreductase [Roseibium salinum]|uniref:SDR family oxidoreductase n=1 Tax=Roseibium salinum TaxID=1604349 RepID=A0ABT3R1X2_9HYPH|nr:SDR family oxidoreductase [Roseibium sp. DSM 29163]MCX2723199.1 SDR family oxidoreductase [Roseibium sp. DSM 29163]